MLEREGQEGKGKKEKEREWKGREEIRPIFESHPASTWLYKHPPFSPIPGSIANTAGFTYTYTGTNAVLYMGRG
jgi:hypothetical protein